MAGMHEGVGASLFAVTLVRIGTAHCRAFPALGPCWCRENQPQPGLGGNELWILYST